MRPLVVAVLLLIAAAACASPTPPTPGATLTATPRPSPTPQATEVVSSSGLAVGRMAVVVAGELHQVADPNRPRDQAYQSPLHPGERGLRTLGESAHVLVVGGPSNPNGDIYWQVADDPFPGCCAPFGWVRESQTSTEPAIAPLTLSCPDPAVPMTGNQLLGAGLMETASCLGERDFSLTGRVRCDQPAVDSFLTISGPDWAHDRTLCIIDDAVALYGPAVTALFDPAAAGFDGQVSLRAHFNDPSSVDCRWGPGSFMPIPIEDAPVDTARFACRMSVYVTSAVPAS